MKCLDFKRLALSDPNSRDHNFIEHSDTCPDCLKYVGGIRQMDADLSSSIDVEMPSDFMARLQLNQELTEEAETQVKPIRRYAIAASFALALFVAGFMASNQFGVSDSIGEDYEALLSGVVDHMNDSTITPVWGAGKANSNANVLLASYQPEMKLKFLSNLQFSRIYGQVTFAYIKGDSVGDLLDASYEGYISRVKPVRGGNLIIVSRSNKAVKNADSQLEKAIYWDI